MKKGIMAEDLNYAKIYFWLCIEYMYNCHESGELQGFDETVNNSITMEGLILL